MKRTSTAVVGALGAGETALRPAVRGAVHVEEGVLLLDTEPRDGIFCEVHDLLCVMTEVGLVGSAVGVVGLGEDEDVVTATEGVLEDGSSPKVDIGVGTIRLVS